MDIFAADSFSSFQNWVKVKQFYEVIILPYGETLDELEDPQVRRTAFIIYDDYSKRYLVIFDDGNSPERKVAGRLNRFEGGYQEWKQQLA